MNLKELSNLLNLSPTTVSRALNGYPEVNADTRQRVAEAARRHGYVPNQIARRLATGRTQAIGHVFPLSANQLVNPLFADFMAGVGETFSLAGYDMVLSVVPEEQEEDTYRSMISHRKVDGFIVQGPKVGDSRIELLSELEVPFVVHGRDPLCTRPYSWLDINNRRAFKRSCELLMDLGHRRISLLSGPETQGYSERRRLGFEAAITERGLTMDPVLIRNDEMVEPFGYAAAQDMLGLADPPTAFVTSSIMIALGVLRAVRERGLEPGRDVSIVTHDDDLSFLPNSGSVPLFTATRSTIRQAGKRIAEIVLGLVNDPGLAPVEELWEVDLVIGRSTGPCQKESRIDRQS